MTRSFNLKRKTGNNKEWFSGYCPLCPFSYNANTERHGAMIRRLHEKKCKQTGGGSNNAKDEEGEKRIVNRLKKGSRQTIQTTTDLKGSVWGGDIKE